MNKLTDIQKDVIRTQTQMMEQAMWDAAKDKQYVYKPKLTLSGLFSEYPRIVMLSMAPVSLILLALAMEVIK